MEKARSSPESQTTWIQNELGRLNDEIHSWPAWMQQLASREVGRLEPDPDRKDSRS
jgi:hypothetical protein